MSDCDSKVYPLGKLPDKPEIMHDELLPPNCDDFGEEHDYLPTFRGRDTYKCSKCGKEIDMTEDDDCEV